MKRQTLEFLKWFGLIFLIYATLLVTFSANRAYPHDMYTGLQKNGTYGKESPCCGDTDCERLEIDDAEEHPDYWVIKSKHYGTDIKVAKHQVTPVALPASADGHWYPVHYCGVHRQPNYSPYGNGGGVTFTQPDPDQLDPSYYTYCVFIAPGGA